MRYRSLAVVLLAGLAPTLSSLAAPPAPGAVPRAVADAGPAAEAAHGGELPLGDPVNATLPADGLAGVWTFTAPGPGVLKLAAGGPEDLALAVATPEGVQASPGFADDDRPAPWTEQLEVPLFSPGVYRVYVEASFGVEGDGAYFLAATFREGEPEPSETLLADDVEAMRALASPRPLGPDAAAEGDLAAGGERGWIAFHRVEAAPGGYVVSSASGADLRLTAVSMNDLPVESGWSIPPLVEWGSSESDNDFGGDLGREALIVRVDEGRPAWVAVRTTDAEPASYRLRLRPLDDEFGADD